MQIILLRSDGSKARNMQLTKLQLISIVSLIVLIPSLISVYLISFNKQNAAQESAHALVNNWQEEIRFQKEKVARMQHTADKDMRALSVKLAEVEARMIRLDALGEHLTQVAKLNKGEFDFSEQPAVGGPEELIEEGDVYKKPVFADALDSISSTLEEREQQLEILESMLVNRNIKGSAYLTGRPVEKGWLSSHYGHRTDPFSGKLAWHKGVDFAGKENSPIISVAAGVITWSGERYGYGNMVEINHGDGYVTRYGHNKENLVQVGDVVRKGQQIAKMGTTGRSTGHHVHFEVFLNGRTMDPKKYIYRRDRG